MKRDDLINNADLTQEEGDKVLRIDCSLGLATMVTMGQVLRAASDKRDFELIQRGLCGFFATSMMAVEKVSQKRIVPHQQQVEMLRQWWDGPGREMIKAAFEAELRRLSQPETDELQSEIESLFSVRH
jgi:hypothetical protein